jgi:peptidoglycan/LPS O-acetylase OafA/YrhL
MRAIAVTIVTLFHLDISGLAGGHIGVDIFFVISGFLISSIIWNKAGKGEFRLGDFYLGRIRRLLPPLYATVLITFAAAAVIMLPDDFARFSKSAIASLFSVSNILFYFEAGYWDTSSHLKPLLHTWSLGVEEQFYLIWPLFIILCASVLRRIPFVLILTVTSGLSVWAMLWYSKQDLSGAFYLFPFRVFQFSLGALVAFAAQLSFIRAPLRVPLMADVCLTGGLALISFSLVTLGDLAPFPGVNALPPTFGTMLLLFAGSGPSGQGLLGRLLLTNPISILLGKISYAAYLVHWPIIVLYRYETGDGFTLSETAGLGAATIIAAVLLHYGIERRFYRRAGETEKTRSKQLTNGRFAVVMLMAGLSMAAVAGHAYATKGWVWRFPQIALTPDQIAAGKQDRFRYTAATCSIARINDVGRCAPIDGAEIDVLTFGNSHEPDGYNFIMAGYEKSDPVQLIKFGTINDCGEIEKTGPSWTAENEGCQSRLDTLFSEDFVRNLEVIVYSSYQPYAISNSPSVGILEDLKRANPQIRIIVFGGYIGTKDDCSYLLNRSGKSAACRAPAALDYFENEPASLPLHARMSDITDLYIDRVDLHCTNRDLNTCETETPDGVPFIYDRHHASLEFAMYGGQKYSASNPDMFRRLMGNRYPSTLPQAGEIAYRLNGQYGDIKSSPSVNAEVVDGGVWLTPVGPFNDRRTGADTGVAHVVFGGNLERRLSGRKVRARFQGLAEGETEVWLQYSTNDVGNSGWIKVKVSEGPFEVFLDYDVPVMSRGGGDFVGIAPISAPFLLEDIEVTIAE